MKKVITVICIISLIVFLFSLIFIIIKKNNSNQNKLFFADNLDSDMVFETFISAVDQKNAAQLDQLFAGNISAKPDFSKQTDMLLNFYTGITQRYSKVAEYTSGEKDYGYELEETMLSYIVYSSTGQYCVAIQYCTKDSTDKGNIGITSLYIAEKKESSELP